MPVKIKIRSVSVEDLGNIVKHMIDGVLEDNEQVAKLHQAVFKEYYFKKMEDLKREKAEIDADYELMQVNASSESHQSLNAEIVETIDALPDDEGPADPADCSDPPMNSSRILSNSSVDMDTQNAERNPNSLVAEPDPPLPRVKRRPKYIRVFEEADSAIPDICTSNIALGLANQNTTTNLTQTANENLERREEHMKIKKDDELSSDTEIVEWRSEAMRRGSSGGNGPSEKTRKIPVEFKSKGEMAFEKWTKEKTETYHRVFREERKRRRINDAARDKQTEKKEAAKEAYSYWRRRQDSRQRLRNNRRRITAEMESQKIESNEKRKANSQAFRVWKKQKDLELRERKMFMMAYDEQSYSQQRTKPQKPKQGVHVTFNTWLDQLDSVLHQKYLRERRYLVRSFYCQPAYFGTAALCGR